MKVIARLKSIELVDADLGSRNATLPLQKLSFNIPAYPNHEMYSFHIPIKREGKLFAIGEYYNINVTKLSKKESEELKEFDA